MTTKGKFVINHNEWAHKDGSVSRDISLELPGEGFETYFIPQEYEHCDDPEGAMRETAEKQFINDLEFMLFGRYKELGIVDYEHSYDDEGKPHYKCWYPDTDMCHYPELKAEDMSRFPYKYCLIEAGDLEELEIRLELALEKESDKPPEPKMPSMHFFAVSFKTLIEKHKELEGSDEFWWLLDLMVFGIYEEREFARKRINEMISGLLGDPYNSNYNRISARDAKKAKFREMSKPQKLDLMKAISESQKLGLDLFNKYLEDAVSDGIIHSPSGLAPMVGVDTGYLNNVRGGKRKISKAAALRIGIGIHLNPENMTRFLASVDHYFPVSENDHLICAELEKHNFDIYELEKFLPNERGSRDKSK